MYHTLPVVSVFITEDHSEENDDVNCQHTVKVSYFSCCGLVENILQVHVVCIL